MIFLQRIQIKKKTVFFFFFLFFFREGGAVGEGDRVSDFFYYKNPNLK